VLKAFLRSDASIQREIRRVLSESVTSSGTIECSVVRGVVHLRGAVESKAQANRLVRLIGGVPGVVGVESFLSAHAPGRTTA
jgi:osmotically-inducible protein OsmY